MTSFVKKLLPLQLVIGPVCLLARLYATLTSPNKDETGVHGYHCQGDMVEFDYHFFDCQHT